MNRSIDKLGRIVIPKEIRKKLKIEDFSILNIEVVDEKIVLTKNADKMENISNKLKALSLNMYDNGLEDFSNALDDIIREIY